MSPGNYGSDLEGASYLPENQSPIKPPGTIFEINFEDDEFTNKYEELEKLGEGGAATVYKIKCRETKKLYAAKVMGNRDADKAQNSREEFNLMKGIPAHPNIVQAVEFLEGPCWTHLVMELAEGQQLQDYFAV